MSLMIKFEKSATGFPASGGNPKSTNSRLHQLSAWTGVGAAASAAASPASVAPASVTVASLAPLSWGVLDELDELTALDELDAVDVVDPESGGVVAVSSPLHATKLLAMSAANAAAAPPRNFSVVWFILPFPSPQVSKI
ncbi:MAG TPA: hypothetical protein VEK07_07400 [Polyangiaceae bacterium]|nr:hypothetical protein [Polyangiaceae bacterium]